MRKRITTHLPRPNPAQKPDQPLLDYLPLVRILALQIHGRLPRNVEIDDLYSAGLVGLIEAFAKYDPVKKVPFVAFAQFRIRGAILDSLRLLDWAPRGLRYKGRLIQKAIQKLALLLGHAPSENEIADEMKISLHSYQHLRGDLSNAEIEPLMRKVDKDSGEEELVNISGRLEDDPLFNCLRGEMEERMTAAIESLPDQERLVTTLYYHEEMTMREVGLALRVDPTRISQIHASAVLHLRSSLSAFSPRVGKKFSPLPWHGAKTPKLALLHQ